MPNYIVNQRAQSTGEHEVHETTCSSAPASWNQQALGWHATCQSAVQAARQYYTNVDGCAHCSSACHTK